MHFIFCTHTLGIHHNLESLTKFTKSNPSQTISRPWQQHRYEQPDLHPEHLLHGKVGIFLGPQGKPNLVHHSSDGIPIRAGDDVDGDEGEELQYEWSTEGEREIEPEREAPQVADQVDFMISLVMSNYLQSVIE